MKAKNRLTMTGDDYGLRSVFASLRRDKGERFQPACSDYVADIAGRSSTVIVARNRPPVLVFSQTRRQESGLLEWLYLRESLLTLC